MMVRILISGSALKQPPKSELGKRHLCPKIERRRSGCASEIQQPTMAMTPKP
jgi:hypothetical protein